MIWNHNETPPARVTSSTITLAGETVVINHKATDAVLNGIKLYRQGVDEPIQTGHRIVSADRVISPDGKSVLVNLVTELMPVVEPVPAEFRDGIETPSIIFPASVTHDYEQTIIDGVVTVIQISASPRKDTGERDALKAVKKIELDATKAGLPSLLAKVNDKDVRAVLEIILRQMNLIT